MESIEARSIRIYACLNALKGENSGVLAPLAYFFEEYFYISHGKVFSQSHLVQFAESALGWKITEDIAEDFVPHFESMGWISKRGTSAQVVYIIDHPRPDGGPSDPTIALVASLSGSLWDFMQGHVAAAIAAFSQEELLDRFLKWLMNLQAPVGEGDAASAGPPVPAAGEDDGSENHVGRLEYFFARFVEEKVETDPVLSTSLPNLWAVGMLLEVADEITRPASLSQTSNLRVVIDAPVALNYLGLSGTKSQQGIALVLDSLRAVGCSVCVFDISCHEINRNLSSLIRNPIEDRFGPTADALRAREVSMDFVEHVRDHPDLALASAKVEVLTYTIDSTEALSKFFSREALEDFLTNVGWGESGEAKEHDAQALALTLRLRQGVKSSDLFRNKMIFVTQNALFFKVANRFCIKGQFMHEHHFPAIVYTKRLATIAWLQTGLSIAQTKIPRGILVNVCARITSTKHDVLQQARADIAALSDADQAKYRALATNSRSTRVLMDYYEARPQVSDGANPSEVLARMEQALAEEHERRTAESVAQVEAEAAQTIANIEAQAAEALRLAGASLAAAQDAQERSRERAELLSATVVGEIVRTANRRSFGTRVALVAMFGTVSLALLVIPADWPLWGRGVGIAIAGILAITSGYYTFFATEGLAINKTISKFWADLARHELRRRQLSEEASKIVVEPDGKISGPI